MEYLFGALRVNNEMRQTMRIRTEQGETEPTYDDGQYYTHVESYPDVTLTHSFKVEKLWQTYDSPDNSKYTWYVLSEYNRNIDRSPAAQAGVNQNKTGINRNSANIDYVAMMADINIPIEMTAAAEVGEVSTRDKMTSYADSGMEMPSMDVIEHSPRFEKVKGYYDAGLWNAEMVHNAVGRWITSAEEQEIISAKGEIK